MKKIKAYQGPAGGWGAIVARLAALSLGRLRGGLFPGTNALVPLFAVAINAGTPTSKCIPVLMPAH